MAWIDNTSDSFNNLTLSSDDQDRLDLLLSGYQAAIEKHLGRTIDSTEHDEIVRSGMNGDLLLNHFPVISVARVQGSTVKMLTIQNTSAQDSSYSVTSTGVSLVHYASGVRANNTVTFASNVTMTALATAITAVGSGWSASAVSDYASLPSSDLVCYQFGRAVDENKLMGWKTSNSHLVVQEEIGVISGEFGRNQDVRVIYTAGFASVPQDLQQLLAGLATIGFDRTAGVRSEKLGDYSYSLDSAMEELSRFGINGRSILSQYKDRRV